jgi:hypothetical protein
MEAHVAEHESGNGAEPDRRAFLNLFGGAAIMAPPVVTMLLSTSMSSAAIAASTGGSGIGGTGGDGGDGGDGGGQSDPPPNGKPPRHFPNHVPNPKHVPKHVSDHVFDHGPKLHPHSHG